MHEGTIEVRSVNIDHLCISNRHHSCSVRAKARIVWRRQYVNNIPLSKTLSVSEFLLPSCTDDDTDLYQPENSQLHLTLTLTLTLISNMYWAENSQLHHVVLRSMSPSSLTA